MQLIDRYVNLLIKQYWEKPKAKAEIALLAEQWESLYDFYNSFEREFDLDFARGVQLDTIGKIVGVSRNVSQVVEKIRFGFDGMDNARGFADLFNINIESAEFFDLFELPFTDLQLDDTQFRFFIRAKVAVNNCAAIMLKDERNSIQDIITTLFNGQGYVIDNLNMTLLLYIDNPDTQLIRLITELALLPKPQGVGYKFIFNGGTESFAFEGDPNGLGFGELNNPAIGGTFAELLIL